MARWTSDVVLRSYGNQGQRGSIILYLSKNADPLPFRNQRGGGFMNGWTSQTDRAFYQMQYLTGQDTDEVKMVIGNSHSSGIFSLTVTRRNQRYFGPATVYLCGCKILTAYKLHVLAVL